MTKTLFIINGFARSGKDTFVDLLQKHGPAASTSVHRFSSIDPVRNLLRDMGFPVDNKGPKERDLLAEVGFTVERYNGFRSTKCVEYAKGIAEKFSASGAHLLVTIMCREPILINTIKEMAEQEGFKCFTLLVHRDGVAAAEGATNEADKGVLGMKYDIVIDNSGTLDHLDQAARTLAWHSNYITLEYDPIEGTRGILLHPSKSVEEAASLKEYLA